MNYKNLCDPLVMNTQDSLNFCKRNVCGFCLGTLQPIMIEVDTFNFQCANCKKVIREGDSIRDEKVSNIKYNQAVGESEMSDKPKMTKEQAMKDLGF